MLDVFIYVGAFSSNNLLASTVPICGDGTNKCKSAALCRFENKQIQFCAIGGFNYG